MNRAHDGFSRCAADGLPKALETAGCCVERFVGEGKRTAIMRAQDEKAERPGSIPF